MSKDQGITVFLSSHILSEIEMIASSMAIINKGKTVIQGQVTELMDKEKVVLRISSDQKEKVKDILLQKFKAEILSSQDNYTEYTGKASEVPDVIRLLNAEGINIYEVNKRTKLEDLFLQLTD